MYAFYDRGGRNIAQYQRMRRDHTVIADSNAAQYTGSRINNNVVSKRRSPALSITDCNILMQQAIFADNRTCADNKAYTVIYLEPLPYCR